MSGEPDVNPLEFMASLEREYPAAYSEADCYRDFRNVLLGSEAGRRVLGLLMRWTHPNALSVAVDIADDGRVFPRSQGIEQAAFREGERHVGLQIMRVLSLPPKA